MARNIPVNLIHLRERLIQSDVWAPKEKLTKNDLIDLLQEKIHQVDFNNAKKDVMPFLNFPESTEVWSPSFFIQLLDQIKTQ